MINEQEIRNILDRDLQKECFENNTEGTRIFNLLVTDNTYSTNPTQKEIQQKIRVLFKHLKEKEINQDDFYLALNTLKIGINQGNEKSNNNIANILDHIMKQLEPSLSEKTRLDLENIHFNSIIPKYTSLISPKDDMKDNMAARFAKPTPFLFQEDKTPNPVKQQIKHLFVQLDQNKINPLQFYTQLETIKNTPNQNPDVFKTAEHILNNFREQNKLSTLSLYAARMKQGAQNLGTNINNTFKNN